MFSLIVLWKYNEICLISITLLHVLTPGLEMFYIAVFQKLFLFLVLKIHVLCTPTVQSAPTNGTVYRVRPATFPVRVFLPLSSLRIL